MEIKNIKCIIHTKTFGDIETVGHINGDFLIVGQCNINISKIIETYKINVVKATLTLGAAPIIWLYNKEEDSPSATRAIILYMYSENTYYPLI